MHDGADDGFDTVIVGGPNLGGDRKLFAFGGRSALGAAIKLPGRVPLLSESIDQLAVAVKPRKVHAVGQNFGQVAAVHLRMPSELLKLNHEISFIAFLMNAR